MKVLNTEHNPAGKEKTGSDFEMILDKFITVFFRVEVAKEIAEGKKIRQEIRKIEGKYEVKQK